MKEHPIDDRAQVTAAEPSLMKSGLEKPGLAKPGSARAFILFLAFFFIVWSLRATLFYFIDEGIQSPFLKSAYSNAIKFVLWVIPAVAYVALVKRREPLRFLKISTPVGWKRLLYAGALIALYFAGVIIFERFTSGKTLASLFDASPAEWLAVLLGVAFSPVSEEIFYRGFILSELGERMGFWSANLLTSVLFVLIHWPYWIWSVGFNPSMVMISVAIFTLSLFLGYLVKLTGSIWPAVAAHILNNFIASFLRV